jgi:hypothetical protein
MGHIVPLLCYTVTELVPEPTKGVANGSSFVGYHRSQENVETRKWRLSDHPLRTAPELLSGSRNTNHRLDSHPFNDPNISLPVLIVQLGGDLGLQEAVLLLLVQIIPTVWLNRSLLLFPFSCFTSSSIFL